MEFTIGFILIKQDFVNSVWPSCTLKKVVISCRCRKAFDTLRSSTSVLRFRNRLKAQFRQQLGAPNGSQKVDVEKISETVFLAHCGIKTWEKHVNSWKMMEMMKHVGGQWKSGLAVIVSILTVSKRKLKSRSQAPFFRFFSHKPEQKGGYVSPHYNIHTIPPYSIHFPGASSASMPRNWVPWVPGITGLMPFGPGDVHAGHAQVEPLQLGHDIIP